MEIDTSIKREFYRPAAKFSVNFLIVIAMTFGMILATYNEYIEGKIFEDKGILAISVTIFLLIVVLVTLYQLTNFNEKPWLELSPDEVTYVHQHWFVPWHAVTRIRELYVGRGPVNALRSKFIVLYTDELHHTKNPSASGNTLHQPTKVFTKRDVSIMLDGYKISRKQVERMIRAYAEAHAARATKD
ncbi:hypothetical protein [Roseibium sediminicola]|uniref:PH domain-containing protein n=1 Tax=Roseibium sediminicola TaxID=2933272 RepID=A0ABT0H1A0_9HYPH|nr:hypothetical protein [Roseibium sp. CAU 1639]MCK7615466.1 hypothetical protein [Roseibium sp. CAU 1639]